MMMYRPYTTTTMNKKRKITAGILFCLIFVLCAGIRGFLLADGQIPLSDDASLYEASMIREEKNEPVMTSGVVFAYTEILTDVLKFTGNKLEAVAVMQLLGASDLASYDSFPDCCISGSGSFPCSTASGETERF